MTGISTRAFEDVNEVNSQLVDTLADLKKHFAEKIVDKEQVIIDHYNQEIEKLNLNFNKEFKKQLQRDKEFFEREVVLAKDVELIMDAAQHINDENQTMNEKKRDLEFESFVDNSEKTFFIE